MKKVVAIFVALTILLSAIVPTLVSANEQKKAPIPIVQNKKTIIIHKEEKKESISSKILNKLEDFILKANWTIWFYGLTTFGLIKLFEKLEILDSSEVYEDIKNKDYKSFFKSIKNLPKSAKLVYMSLKESEANKEEYKNLYNELCPDSDKNSQNKTICQIVNISNPQSNDSTNKLSKGLRSVSNPAKSIVKIWDYWKIHSTSIWVGSLIGSIIGLVGTLLGAFNVGLIYGTLMIPYLWSFKSEEKGDLDILANCLDLAGDLWQNGSQKFQEIKNRVKSFFDETFAKFNNNISSN